MHWEPFSSVGSKRQKGIVDGGVGSEAWCEGGDEREVKGGGFERRLGV